MLYPLPIYIHDADAHMIRKTVDQMKEKGTPVGKCGFHSQVVNHTPSSRRSKDHSWRAHCTIYKQGLS